MHGLRKRLAALEGGDVDFKPWHRILVDEAAGETEEAAIAAYEAGHGPLGDDPCFIVRFVI